MFSDNTETILQKAVKDPESIYATPYEVVKDVRISREEQLKILESWALDQSRLLESAAENMGEDVESAKAAKLLQDISKIKATV